MINFIFMISDVLTSFHHVRAKSVKATLCNSFSLFLAKNT